MNIKSYQDGTLIYNIFDDVMVICGDWLFDKLRELSCEIFTYSNHGNYIDLHGSYLKENVIKIKKFLYDNYQFVSIVETRKYGFRVHFKIEVNISN